MKKYLRKGFYVIDLLIVLGFIFFSWPRWPYFQTEPSLWQLTIIFAPLLLRLYICIALYRKQGHEGWATVTFMVLFFLSAWLFIGGYAGRNMYQSLIDWHINARGNVVSLNDFNDISRKIFLVLLYSWVMFVPLVVWVCQKRKNIR